MADEMEELGKNIEAVNSALNDLRQNKGLSEQLAYLQLMFDGNKDLLALQKKINAERQSDEKFREKQAGVAAEIYKKANKLDKAATLSRKAYIADQSKILGITKRDTQIKLTAFNQIAKRVKEIGDVEDKETIKLQKQAMFAKEKARWTQAGGNWAASMVGLAGKLPGLTEEGAGSMVGGLGVTAARGLGGKAIGAGVGAFMNAGGVGMAAVGAGLAAMAPWLVVLIPVLAGVAVIASKLMLVKSQITGFTHTISATDESMSKAASTGLNWEATMSNADYTNRLMIGTTKRVTEQLTRSIRTPNIDAYPQLMSTMRNVGAAFGYAPTPDEMSEFGKVYSDTALLQGRYSSKIDYLTRTAQDLTGTYIQSASISRKMNVAMPLVLQT